MRRAASLSSTTKARFNALRAARPEPAQQDRQITQIDVAVTRDDAASGVLDYRRLYTLAEERVAMEPIDYLEDVAVALAEQATALPGVTHARVAVRKPQVLVGGPLSHAEVIVERGGA